MADTATMVIVLNDGMKPSEAPLTVGTLVAELVVAGSVVVSVVEAEVPLICCKVCIGLPCTVKNQLGIFCTTSATVRVKNTGVVKIGLMYPLPILAGVFITSSESPAPSH